MSYGSAAKRMRCINLLSARLNLFCSTWAAGWRWHESDGVRTSAAKGIPVIILTARGTLQDRLSGLDAGADDYLVKPFVLAELLARVRLARRSYGYQNEAVEIRGLSLHVPTRRVTVSSRHIELTASEYALLETLMLRADRVLTRRFLEERIFGAKENMSNALDVHMGNLRRKLATAMYERCGASGMSLTPLRFRRKQIDAKPVAFPAGAHAGAANHGRSDASADTAVVSFNPDAMG